MKERQTNCPMKRRKFTKHLLGNVSIVENRAYEGWFIGSLNKARQILDKRESNDLSVSTITETVCTDTKKEKECEFTSNP